MKTNTKIWENVLAGAFGLLILFFSLQIGFKFFSFEYYSHFGKEYPDNHLYQAILLMGSSPAEDQTKQFQKATRGESFSQLLAEFRQLGSRQEQLYDKNYKYLSGKTYYFGLDSKPFSKLKIPNFSYDWIYRFGIWVTVKYNSDTDYEVIKASLVSEP